MTFARFCFTPVSRRVFTSPGSLSVQFVWTDFCLLYRQDNIVDRGTIGGRRNSSGDRERHKQLRRRWQNVETDRARSDQLCDDIERAAPQTHESRVAVEAAAADTKPSDGDESMKAAAAIAASSA